MIWIKKIKWFFQRLFRGYAEPDLWSLDVALAKLIIPRLKAFIKYKRSEGGLQGYPYPFHSQEAWDKKLDEMVWALKTVIDQDTCPNIKDNGATQYLKYIRKREKGLRAFGKYFTCLWD